MRALKLFSLLMATFAACGDDEPVPTPPTTAIDIAGTWESEFGGDEVIATNSWTGSTVIEFSNTERFAILQASPMDMFNPSKFSKVVWTPIANDSFYYCTVDFGLATADAAKATAKTANATNPSMSGCGGFSWTRLIKPIEIRGRYNSNFGGMETITSTAWNGTPIRKIDNTNNVAITQNTPTSPFGANLYNRIVWTEKTGGSFYYCFVDFGKATSLLAETSTQTADATTPDTSGCGGFGWTKLTTAP